MLPPDVAELPDGEEERAWADSLGPDLGWALQMDAYDGGRLPMLRALLYLRMREIAPSCAGDVDEGARALLHWIERGQLTGEGTCLFK